MAVIQAIIVKNFPYRGLTEEYANVYHLSGTEPADSSAWDTLLTAIRDAEKPILSPEVTFTDGYGYNEGSWETKPTTADAHTVWTTSNVGTLSLTGQNRVPGDGAYWVRWSTGDVTDPGGKPIYLRKYFHPAYWSSAAGPDNVVTATKTALVTYANKFTDGTSLGGSLKICRPNGHVGVTALAGDYITTRTLHRRGKRPNP